jgi:hypothetical protein
MMMNDLTTLLSVASVLALITWITEKLTPLIDQWFNRLQAETKNTLILNLEIWARQIVHEIESGLDNATSSMKKETAMKLLTERITHNKISGYFPDEVVSSYIEDAVSTMNKEKKGQTP